MVGWPIAGNNQQLLALDTLGSKVQPHRIGVPCCSEVGGKGPFSTAGAQQISQALPGAIFAGDILVRLYANDEKNILLMQESQPIKANELSNLPGDT